MTSTPPRPLTADLCATAIVAASRALRLDPIRACVVDRSAARRPMAPAAAAIALATQLSESRVSTMLHLSVGSVSRARRYGHEGFLFALTQALIAIGGAALANAPIAPVVTAPATESDVIEGEFVEVRPAASVAKIRGGRDVSSAQDAAERSAPGRSPVLTPNGWTARQKQEAPEMWRVGESGASIAAAVGLTKDQVVGAAHRLKWPRDLQLQRHGPQPRKGRRPARPLETLAPRQVCASDQALIDQALAAGRVTHCDPQVAAGVELRGLQLKPQPLPEPNGGWRAERERTFGRKSGAKG